MQLAHLFWSLLCILFSVLTVLVRWHEGICLAKNLCSSLKSVNFWQSYSKNKRWTFLGHGVYIRQLVFGAMLKVKVCFAYKLMIICTFFSVNWFSFIWIAHKFLFHLSQNITSCPKHGTRIVNSLHPVYTVSQKTRHYTPVHNFAKCLPIFKLLSLLDSVGNL